MNNNSIRNEEELNFGKAVYFKYEPKDNITCIVNNAEENERRKAEPYSTEPSGSFRCTRHNRHPNLQPVTRQLIFGPCQKSATT